MLFEPEKKIFFMKLGTYNPVYEILFQNLLWNNNVSILEDKKVHERIK